MRLAGRQREISQERLGRLGREGERRAGLEACFKSAKQPELYVRLGRHRSLHDSPACATVAQRTAFSTVLETIRIRSPDTTEEEGAIPEEMRNEFGSVSLQGSTQPRSGGRSAIRSHPSTCRG